MGTDVAMLVQRGLLAPAWLQEGVTEHRRRPWSHIPAGISLTHSDRLYYLVLWCVTPSSVLL